MNRLILIGNGFDLAHGLKTSYKDFITDYLYNAISSFYQTSNPYEDDLIKIHYHSSGSSIYGRKVEPQYDKLLNEMTFINSRNGTNSRFAFKSEFFQHLIHHCANSNWVDIENEYFDKLKTYRREHGFLQSNVLRLNAEFEFLKNKLKEYLITVNNIGTNVINKKYENLFCEKIDYEDIIMKTASASPYPEQTLILNFNYTSTFKKYYKACSARTNIKINFIHGELEQEDNEIIFGFGDEYDKVYRDFEDFKDNSLFTHVKSFNYFKTSNYHNLMRFINADEFQVYIVGHSCGLSDRTMLKQIFEHQYCKSIKIFHHLTSAGNDYTEKTFNISRHFTDKILMRQKIVPFNKLHQMPQT